MQRQNANVTLIKSGSYTASQNSPDITNPGCKGVVVVVDITSGSSLQLTVAIKGKDEVSGKYTTLLASATLTGTGTTVLRIYPGLTPSSNQTVSDVLPRTWRVEVTAGNGNAAVYSVGGLMVV